MGKRYIRDGAFNQLEVAISKDSMAWKGNVRSREDADIVMLCAASYSVTWTGAATGTSSKEFSKYQTVTDSAALRIRAKKSTKFFIELWRLGGVFFFHSRHLDNGDFKHLNFVVFVGGRRRLSTISSSTVNTAGLALSLIFCF